MEITNNRVLFALLVFLIVVLIVFIALSIATDYVSDDLEKTQRHKYDIPIQNDQEAIRLCLNGTQSDRARNCPKLVRYGTRVLNNLRTSCEQENETENIEVMFNGKIYECDNIELLNLNLNKLINALRLR